MSENESLSGLIAALKGMEGPPEKIGEMKLEDAIQFVDLSIAYAPILFSRNDDYMTYVVKPDRVSRDGLRKYVQWPNLQEWRWLDEKQLKEKRARYLLTRGEYYRTFGGFPYPEQQKIIAYYFEGSMWRPETDSPLHRAMGLI